MAEFVLTLSCPDRIGIVHAVSGFIAERGCNIVDSQQFGDQHTGRFFLRVRFAATNDATTYDALQVGFAPIGGAFAMEWAFHDTAERPRVLLLVSRLGHCLNDLLYRHRSGTLPGDVVAVVSNHPTCAPFVEPLGVPYYHLPMTAESKPKQEQRLLDMVEEHAVDLVVLARYMQILSYATCQKLAGRAINIHHSFLPGFKGAKPYHQAHARGVKVIGATAHYVTADLDEGPIIEQQVAPVDHSLTPDQLVAVGRDLESVALARAVTAHLEHRVLLNDTKTVVFR